MPPSRHPGLTIREKFLSEKGSIKALIEELGFPRNQTTAFLLGKQYLPAPLLEILCRHFDLVLADIERQQETVRVERKQLQRDAMTATKKAIRNTHCTVCGKELLEEATCRRFCPPCKLQNAREKHKQQWMEKRTKQRQQYKERKERGNAKNN